MDREKKQEGHFLMWTSDQEVAELIQSDLAQEIIRNDAQEEFGVFMERFRGGFRLWVGRHDE